MRLAILSDAHLLIQAEWVEDEERRTKEGDEVLENFAKVANQITTHKVDAILLAGDMFDDKTKSGQRVAHREGEKYMAEIREVTSFLARNTKYGIYALKGNHDSHSVLKSTERALKGDFHYVRNDYVDIEGLKIFLMTSNYEPGYYELSELPSGGDILLMHESVPLNIPGLSLATLRQLCSRFRLVLNGHMHVFATKVLENPNLYLLPALLPSREIKGNWMLKYRWPEQIEPTVKPSPFGYVLVDDGKVTFQPYEPLQKVVRVEISGKTPQDFLTGLKEIYDLLETRDDRSNLRVWVVVDTDLVTIEKVLWPEVRRYKEITTVDILRMPKSPEAKEDVVQPEVEYGDKAFTLEELVEKTLASLGGKQREIAKQIFERIFTKDYLSSRTPDMRSGFKSLLELLSTQYQVSDTFPIRAWRLAKKVGEI